METPLPKRTRSVATFEWGRNPVVAQGNPTMQVGYFLREILDVVEWDQSGDARRTGRRNFH